MIQLGYKNAADSCCHFQKKKLFRFLWPTEVIHLFSCSFLFFLLLLVLSCPFLCNHVRADCKGHAMNVIMLGWIRSKSTKSGAMRPWGKAAACWPWGPRLRIMAFCIFALLHLAILHCQEIVTRKTATAFGVSKAFWSCVTASSSSARRLKFLVLVLLCCSCMLWWGLVKTILTNRISTSLYWHWMKVYWRIGLKYVVVCFYWVWNDSGKTPAHLFRESSTGRASALIESRSPASNQK